MRNHVQKSILIRAIAIGVAGLAVGLSAISYADENPLNAATDSHAIGGNPLDDLGNPAPSADALPAVQSDDFATLGTSSGGGQTLYKLIQHAQSLDQTIGVTADALGKIFDAKPTLSGGFADASFNRDLPVMNDILASEKVDEKWLAEHIKDENEAARIRGEAFRRSLIASAKRSQDRLDQQRDSFDRFQAEDRARTKAMDNSAADEIELISGARDVYDNATGEMKQVDYYNSTAIVHAMNDAANDQGRYVEVPLRYER